MEQQVKNLKIKLRRYTFSKSKNKGLIHFQKEIIGESKEDSLVLVFNCDIASSFPLTKLIESHLESKGSKCTVMAKEIPKNELKVKNYGILVLDETKRVVHYAEKPETYINNIINCGVSYQNKIKRFIVLMQV
jgi:mannose-1-phosphate guanylyltransferase